MTILETNVERMRYLDNLFHGAVTTLASNHHNLVAALSARRRAVGAVLIPGRSAPKLVTREMLSLMKKGAVVVDVAVDQGGCFETTRPTTHSDPVYEVDGVVHYCVANMPGAVPRTSTFALNNATFPYALALADKGVVAAVAGRLRAWPTASTPTAATSPAGRWPSRRTGPTRRSTSCCSALRPRLRLARSAPAETAVRSAGRATARRRSSGGGAVKRHRLAGGRVLAARGARRGAPAARSA